ncbi:MULTISPECIES: M48 family metalloprotease [unclassified Streptomyces]|uniref:M48 family metalloprotease n=1 Tax=unclassified Streptomyces TaxID=2593676 RepID=UPI00036F67E8|nr:MULTISPECIES: M48 family metalloprotease [unclassified Streptomyces]MYT27605.1 M48 family metalloprotease [Streptomyces sp. SID8354]
MKARTALRSATGTGPRFALLMFLVVASSIPTLDTLLQDVPVLLGLRDGREGLHGPSGCEYAAGFDPGSSDLENLLRALVRPDALQKCIGDHTLVPYRGALATLALLALAAGLYWWLPTARERWRRTVPLETVDADGTLRAELAALCARTGVRARLRFRVDPTRTTSGASVHGRSGNYTVTLHSGLLPRLDTDPEGFRAVVLHELAHVHHRDVDYAYASTALWRAYVLLALIPTFAVTGWILFLALSGTKSPWWPGAAAMLLSPVLVGLLLAVLVHLARADLLRRRELFADRRAVIWGADTASWQRPDPVGPVAPWLRRLTALLGTHPRWEERRRALVDAGRLHRVSPLAMFLTGISAALLYQALATLPVLSHGPGSVWITVGAVTPVLCFALGLPLVRASGTADGDGRSAAVAGLWLGFGLLLGEFVSSGEYRIDWMLPRPQYLLAFLPIAAVPAVWWSQSLRLALALPRCGRRAATVCCALVTATVLWAGLQWWRTGGRALSLGAVTQGAELAAYYARTVPGDWHGYGPDLSAFTTGLVLLTPLSDEILVGVAALLMWLVPLALALLRRTGPPGTGLRLRRTLGAGLAGALVCGAGLVLAQLMMNQSRPTTKGPAGPLIVVHVWWVTVTVLAACLLTAAVVAARARRRWLPRALIAAQVVQLLAYAEVFLLFSADGCLGPLNTAFDVCRWRPRNGLIIDGPVTSLTLVNAVLGSACAALAGAGLAWAVRRFRGRPTADNGAEPASRAAGRPPSILLKAGTLLTLAVPAVVLAAVTFTQATAQDDSRRWQDAADAAREQRGPAPPAQAPQTRAWQAASWLNDGGTRHAQQINAASIALDSELLKAASGKRNADGKVALDEKALHRLCGALSQRVEEARDYFPVPDRNLQKNWSAALNQVHHGAQDCQEATFPPKGAPHRTDAERERLFTASLNEIVSGMRTFGTTVQDIKKAATSLTK